MANVWKPVAPALLGGAVAGALVKKLWLSKYQKQAQRLAGAEAERDLLYTWLLLKQKEVPLTEFFKAQGSQRLAVLGMGRIGRRFVEEVRKDAGPVSVEYGIEADVLGAVHEELAIYRLMDDPLPAADCMVVCDLEGTAEKVATVRREFSGEVVTLAHVMAWLLKRHGIESRDGAIDGWPAL